MRVAIIGGGAAGFFAAISAKENYQNAQVIIFEKKGAFLSKVKISGGGRCNVTNACDNIEDLCNAYPRGGKSLKKAFHLFNNIDTMKWFEDHNVPLVVQEDQCVFPESQNSQSILDCLIGYAKELGVELSLNSSVAEIHIKSAKFEIGISNSNSSANLFDKVIVTTGGAPKIGGLKWLEKLNHKIEPPVPSLFTFNIPQNSITNLMGIVIEKCIVSIQGTKLKSEGAVLITHWGLSGPGILKLSSFGARILNEMDYQFKVQISWVNNMNTENVLQEIHSIIKIEGKKNIGNYRINNFPDRFWKFLLDKIKIDSHKKWDSLNKKEINKLCAVLSNDIYEVNGKSTFKEEFVTCGGVSLKSVNMNTLESKSCKNLYFAGEVLDIDAITGGYNLQAAWTTGYIAGKLL